ncbi:MAG: ATP-dependent DNA helicase UvrD2 [Acidimicrobiia bacterium]|nr:ATP-dependent DNA helicase UvrD2 [Acidimicrobiia bacterium]
MNPDALLDDLDDLQRRAVTTPANPLRILAGAGSGKTRVLTRRIAWRVANDDADPRKVLALTFTRKAAGELRARIRTLGLRDEIAAGTFHGVAYAQIRMRWADRGVEPWQLVDRKVPLVAPLLPASARGGTAVLDVVGEIEWAAARRITPSRYVSAARRSGRRTQVAPEVVAEVFERYEVAKRKRRLVDFDDLLRGWRKALLEDDAFAAAQRWRFSHLFVDEFQDVNPLQQALLEAIAGDRPDLCVVGDPRQAIYAWNGADARFLVDFDRYWPGGASVELVDNYRSTPQVLDAAAAVLSHAQLRVASVRLRAHRPDGPPVAITPHPNDQAEATAIARAVRRRHRPGASWSRQAVLVRTNAQTALIEQALRRASVPVRVRGGSGLADQPEVRRVLDDVRRRDPSLDEVIADLDLAVRDLRQRSSDPGEASPEDVEAPTGSDDRAANLEALLRLARDYRTLMPNANGGAFVTWLSHAARTDAEGIAVDAVEIATFHAAKGLEWSVVHLAGLEDGLVPIGHAKSRPEQDEERRLFYVALTRAQDELHCTWSEERTFGARTVSRRRSPYLDEIDAAGDEPVPTPRPRRGVTGKAQVPPTPGPPGLREELRRWRSERARASRAPAYTVFNDETLDDLTSRRPTTRAELLTVRGIGPVKAARFGDDLLALIADHAEQG